MRNMVKFLFTLLLLFAGYVAYMYFFGKGEDKANAKTIVAETKDLAASITLFMSHQKEVSYDNAEFEELIQKIQAKVDDLKTKVKQESDPAWNQLRDIQLELKKVDPQKLSNENRVKLKKALNELEEILKS
jgi:cbb3-type cytochrome oxidase subunit 3